MKFKKVATIVAGLTVVIPVSFMNVSSKNNDIMSSYENKSGTNARWYHDADGKGRCVTMLAYRSDNDINTWDDDELTSWATNGSC